jgi:hypothetical protein
MEQLAYVTFVLVVCIIFTYSLGNAKKYGQQLKRLREQCLLASHSNIDSIHRKMNDITTVVVDKEKDESILSESDADDEIIWVYSKSSTSHKITFMHVPDLQNVHSHMIAIYKVDGTKFAYISYVPV